MKSLRLIAGAATIVAASLALAACGTTADPVTNDTDSGDASAAITVTDSSGNEVTLPDGPATKVVALEWEQAEILSSLGVELVGVSDPDGFTSWSASSTPLIGDPADVGTRGEPSIETIAELEPDLIVGSPSSVPESVADQMSDIAPVLLLSATSTQDPFATLGEVTETYATVVGKDGEGTALMTALEEKLAANAKRIADAGKAGTPAVFAAIYADANNVVFRVEAGTSRSMAVIEALGLTSAWTGEVDEEYGLAYTDAEGLTALSDDSWMYYWANKDSDDPIETLLADNAIWNSLPLVTNKQVLGVADGVWLYGGPQALGAFSDEITESILAG